MPFVLDDSVVCGGLIENHATDYSDAVAKRLVNEPAFAPALLPWEYTHVLRTACKRGRLTAADAQQAIRQLGRLSVRIDDHRPDPALLLALALRYDLSGYDAVYLELGLRLQVPIATQDAQLADAAQVAGIGILVP